MWPLKAWSLNPPCLLASPYVSFLILQNPLHVTLQPLLVTCSGADVFRRNNVFRHPTTWPSFTNPAQDPIGEHHGVEGTLIIKSSLRLSKLPWDMTSGVVRTATKPNQSHTMILVATMDHAWDMPPFHDLLNVSLLKETHKLHVHFKAHDILRPAISKMPRKVGVEGYSTSLKQPKTLL